MKLLTLSLMVTGCTHGFKVAGSTEVPKTSLTQEPKFTTLSLNDDDQNNVFVLYNSELGKSYFWLSLKPIGVKYPSERRAREVKDRLEKYRLEKMNELQWGNLAGEQIICALTSQKPDNCQIIVTVPPDKDPKEVIVLLKCKLENRDDPKCSKPIKL